ncbi:Hpt domain-containing protein [Desulfovibrio sp. TomC]|uniref:Hpt domain-containing protein n=1 Tax=Desulfovibrio sp. TomC TaxID=1562888 RepID=UPI000573562B|nr:STAS domain-containing protein [Desulfovibrio sp. TomC]KHK01411.1 Signal transduction histidine kinase CheA [Desulfovibrio sp. TomC]
MDQMDDEILAMFIEDTREHLANIETALMDMDRLGADIDEELVNTVFRAAHSIKGGAGFLNLNNTRDLSHRLENLLHMIRSREIVPETRIINQLLTGFDRLLALVEAGPASDAEDISELLASLSGIATEHLSTEQRAEAVSIVPVALPGGEVIFELDALTLRQGASGGKNLYLVEYDLIHDVQARGKTPFDVIATMESSGLIVDCRMELAAVGDLDAPPVNRIPFYVLYASIVEPDIIGYLFALDVSRIHPFPLPEPPAAPVPAGVAAAQDFGPWQLSLDLDTASLRLGSGQAPDAGTAREALLAALSQGLPTTIDWGAPPSCDLAMLQVLVAAARTYAARGLDLTHVACSPVVTSTAARAGITPAALAAAGLPGHLFAACPGVPGGPDGI